ncbi:MAG: hypothetical protein BJBARM4_0590 [Candidatus Parvarchaeum acidiphilum ARMAN-4]|jgi:hypothetical protein|uniref:Uncharacterized protein n=1 Tax=Candidatus Parvarchaeum acidiphilum ARMAN-4 TaxID=662760 RepID=D2EFR5_PARA4|nr:MAG: hypothetical protein BJBARM4_0590 [Candidatus Parvarchaeum acidiphilum ARMAN-4]
MINMKGLRNYLLLALLIVFLIGFIAAGKTSPAYKAPVTQAVNCGSANLNFVYSTNTNVKAPEGTNTFFNIYVNNTGNVTEDIGLTVTPSANAPFFVKVANSTELNISKEVFTSFGVYSPSKLGNYSVVANLSASYLNCVNYKIIPINVIVVNSTSVNSTS